MLKIKTVKGFFKTTPDMGNLEHLHGSEGTGTEIPGMQALN